MSGLALLEKNAYLSISIDSHNIYSVLAYSHYEIGRQYTLVDHTQYDLISAVVGEASFWQEYFQALEEKFDWDFVEMKSKDLNLGRIVPFSDESIGVAGVRVNISERLQNRGHIVSSLREYIPSVNINIIDQNKKVDMIRKVRNKLGYKDVLHLNLDLVRFDLLVDTSDKDKASHCKINWNSKSALIESIRDSRLKAFSGVDIDGGNVYNNWANFVLKPTYESNDKVLHDLLRSYISVQLLSLYNANKEMFKGLGEKGKPTLVVLSGDLVDILDERELLLAFLDSIQINGVFDLIVDKHNLINTLGYNYKDGINSKDFIVLQEQILPEAMRVYVPQIPGKGTERKVVFDGQFLNNKTGEIGIYGLTPNIITTKLPDNKERTIFDGKFTKGAYIEGESEQIHFTSEEFPYIKSVLIDCRFKPVIYGPDYRKNSDKLKLWLGE